MSRLLSAGARRLRRSKVFFITLAAIIALSLLLVWTAADSINQSRGGIEVPIENYYFDSAPYTGAVAAIFISLFLAPEYSDGVIRNKLIAGHTRREVYFSNFLLCLVSSVIFLAVWLLSESPIFLTSGHMNIGAGRFVLCIAVAVCFMAAFAAIFTPVCMLCTNRALSLLFCILIWVGLILLASGLDDRLCTPENLGGMMLVDGQFVMTDPTPNPLYLTGFARSAVQFVLEALPTGQAILLTTADVPHPARQIILSLVVAAVSLLAGNALFAKKDIK